MFGWFGRKSAPERQPFVPAWLTGEVEAGGFARGIDGLRAVNRASGETMLRLNGSWQSGIVRAQELRIGGQAVVRGRQAAVAAPSGGATVDTECRSAVVALLAALQAHGLIG